MLSGYYHILLLLMISPEYKAIPPSCIAFIVIVIDASHREYPGFCSVHVLLCTVSQLLQFDVAAHYIRIQLKHRIYSQSMSGIKAIKLGPVADPECAHPYFRQIL